MQRGEQVPTEVLSPNPNTSQHARKHLGHPKSNIAFYANKGFTYHFIKEIHLVFDEVA